MRMVIRTSVLTFVMLLMGCSSAQVPASSEATPRVHFPNVLARLTQPTKKLQDLSSDLIDEAVHVEGEVQQHAPLLDSWLYQIADNTAAIWVASSNPPPTIGASVRIRGIVRYEQILIGSTDVGEYYLEEASRVVMADAENSGEL